MDNDNSLEKSKKQQRLQPVTSSVEHTPQQHKSQQHSPQQQTPQQHTPHTPLVTYTPHTHTFHTPHTPHTPPRSSTRPKSISSSATLSSGSRSRIPSLVNATATFNIRHHTAGDSTTPVSPKSTTPINNSRSDAKIDFSDLVAVDSPVLGRIKSLEIDLRQHRDSETQLQRRIRAARQELVKSRDEHQQFMRSGEEQLKYLDQGNEDLHARSLANSAQLQELWGKERELQERLDKLNDEILKYKYDFLQAKEGWEQVRADRDETDRDELKYVRAKQTVLSEDIKETSELLAEVQKQMNCMEAEFGDEPVEKLRQELQEKRQRAEQLEVLLAKLKSAMEVEEKSADELIFMFEKVYERRIRTYAAECAEELAFEEKMERERDQEANAALEEYLRMNQLSIEAEEEASREEFNLLTEKEELSRLESTLHALKIELSTRSNSIAT